MEVSCPMLPRPASTRMRAILLAQWLTGLNVDKAAFESYQTACDFFFFLSFRFFSYKRGSVCRTWWSTPVDLLQVWGQSGLHSKLQASQSYTVRCYLSQGGRAIYRRKSHSKERLRLCLFQDAETGIWLDSTNSPVEKPPNGGLGRHRLFIYRLGCIISLI
jgi:hypothetical protein